MSSVLDKETQIRQALDTASFFDSNEAIAACAALDVLVAELEATRKERDALLQYARPVDIEAARRSLGRG